MSCPRISAPGQALRLVGVRSRVQVRLGSPRISASGQALRRPRNRPASAIPSCPRISAPGQALRRRPKSLHAVRLPSVPEFLPLGRHCDVLARRPGTPGFCPRISAPGQALRPDVRTGELRPSHPVPGFLPLGRHCDTSVAIGTSVTQSSQDFCPWAGIATGIGVLHQPRAITSQDFCPWAGIATM